jgi:GTP-binding protein
MNADNFLKNIGFLTSANALSQCPEDTGLEVAFAGRSNAGKSSALNCITERTRLAKTSKTPGRTQLINFFDIDEQRRLVDLPGYGYAKVANKVKEHWQRLLERYLEERQSLQGMVLLMDIRHPLKDFDRLMLEWAIDANVKTHILLSKSDKVNQQTKQRTVNAVRKEYGIYKHLISVQAFSSLKKHGIKPLKQTLATWLDIEPAPTDSLGENNE